MCKNDCIDDLINDLDSLVLLLLLLSLFLDFDEADTDDVEVSTAPLRSKGLVHPHSAPTSIIDNISSDNQLLVFLFVMMR
jgi:hypothetical protein